MLTSPREGERTALMHDLEEIAALTALDSCPNCGEERGSREFCSGCGQKRAHREERTVKHFFKNALHEATDLDSKVYRTFAALFFRPGLLTVEYLAGRWGTYVRPLRLYLIVSAAFFFLAWDKMLEVQGFDNLVAQAVGNLPKPQGDMDAFVEQIGRKSGDYSAYSRFGSVLFLAAFLKLLYRRKHLPYVDHLIFSLHYYAFDFAFFTLAIPVFRALSVSVGVLTVASVVPLLIYTFLALWRVHGESALKTSIKSFLVLVGDVLLTNVATIIAINVAYAVVSSGAKP